MKLYTLFIILSLLLMSCTVNEKPEFVKVNSLEVVEISIRNFILEADVQFLNKNSIGGILEARDFHVFIDSIDVAVIKSEPFIVPKKNEFKIPLRATIPFEKVFNDNKQNLLNSIMNVVSKKDIMVTYKGKIRYKLGAFHYDYPIVYKQEVSLKK